jgi:biotin-(acetyl-CoA carboxylase) ligase
VIQADATSIDGQLCGVNDQGALLIETAQGMKAVYSGDLQVVPAQ